MKWKCWDGRVLDIKEMTTEHLKNVIAMLRRNRVVTFDEYLSCAAHACSGSCGEYSAMAAESELDSMKPWAGLEKLEAELERRPKT
jgi:hypothetical protein